MKFLSKNPDSPILKSGLVYKQNASANNSILREQLVKEQHQFCAYTERYILNTDSPEIDHINSSIKYKDDYFNYYAVIGWANKKKKDELFVNAGFFSSLFFQDQQAFSKRIKFIDNTFEEIDLEDQEAKDFIEFLGLNHPDLFKDRLNHINKLKSVFEAANFNTEEKLAFLHSHPQELSFVTALEDALGLELNGLIQSL